MEALGLESFLSSGTAHATGITEIIRHLPAYFALFHEILRRVPSLRPDVIVLVDNPGFNLRLAKKLAGSGIPVVGYVSPQVWAWKEGRTKLMARVYKKVLTLFDFEEPFLKARGVDAVWIGHPITEIWPPSPRHMERETQIGSDVGSGGRSDGGSDGRLLDRPGSRSAGRVRQVVLLPGSRPHEVRSLLPIMLEAGARISRAHPTVRWSLLEADTLSTAFYDALLGEHGTQHADAASSIFLKNLDRRRGDKQELFWSSDLALACSGTVTLECALAGLPAVLGYRASAITAFLARLLLKVRWLGMPNLLAKKEVMPELLQENFTAEKLERAALNFIENPARLIQARADLAAIRSHLGPPGSSDRAATEILSLL